MSANVGKSGSTRHGGYRHMGGSVGTAKQVTLIDFLSASQNENEPPHGTNELELETNARSFKTGNIPKLRLFGRMEPYI